MTPIEVCRFVRGLVSRGEWARGFTLRDRPGWVFVGRVRLGHWTTCVYSFERRCGTCQWFGQGMPGDGCPECGATAED